MNSNQNAEKMIKELVTLLNSLPQVARGECMKVNYGQVYGFFENMSLSSIENLISKDKLNEQTIGIIKFAVMIDNSRPKKFDNNQEKLINTCLFCSNYIFVNILEKFELLLKKGKKISQCPMLYKKNYASPNFYADTSNAKVLIANFIKSESPVQVIEIKPKKQNIIELGTKRRKNPSRNASKRSKIEQSDSDSDFIVASSDDDDEDWYQEDEEKFDDEDKTESDEEALDEKFMEKLYSIATTSTEKELMDVFNKMDRKTKKKTMKQMEEVTTISSDKTHSVMKILNYPLSNQTKANILKNWLTLAKSRDADDKHKLKTWFDILMTIPFGVHKGIDIGTIKPSNVKSFLDKLNTSMNEAVFGHDEAKRQIIQFMAQRIKNPKCKGNILGIYGPPGNGKSSLVKEGIAKSMDKPFLFISLGGAQDGSYLEGHGFTYTGSIHGRIVEGLIEAKCMDPIIYFDELDKISKTHRGDEIKNILVHLTDPVQNAHFRDKYFHGIDIDLSKATIIFSYNDPDNVDPILLDRITKVNTKALTLQQKLNIAQNYLLKDIVTDVGYKFGDITISDKVINILIDKYTREGGVRKLKALLYELIREINIAHLTKTTLGNDFIFFPYEITENVVNHVFKKKRDIVPDKINPTPEIGHVNGLWANSMGCGGVLPIQARYYPSKSVLDIKTTGSLGKVIEESTSIASTVAWSLVDEEIKSHLQSVWKNNPAGIHIHFPDGSTNKNGPSAGLAICSCLYSLLTGRYIRNDIAMTGEIDLTGKAGIIGGIQEKFTGAKNAGVKTILYPKDNQKDVDLFLESNPTFLEGIEIYPVETIQEVISYSII